LLTESSLLALLGGTIGVFVSIWIMRALVALAPPELPRLDSIRPDWRVFAFALGITLMAAVVAGMAPALWTAGGNLAQSLRSGRRVGTGDGRMRAVRQSLVVGQIALALLVLAGAGLLIRSLYELQGVDMGFAQERLIIAESHLPVAKHGTRPQKLTRLDRVQTHIEAIPGVLGVTPLAARPFSGTGGIDAMYIGEGQTPEQQATNPWINLEQAGPDYFRTLEISIIRGRGFSEQDSEQAVPVAVVSQAAAERTWPGEDPIGKRLKLGGPETPDPWRTVVGVVVETRYRELVTPRPTLYLPFTQFGGPWVPTDFAVRISAGPTAVIPAMRSALREVDPDLSLLSARTMREHLSGPLARPRFSAVLLGALAFLAMTLAAVGIYGVMAAFVRQGTHEIGVRLALGAQTGDVRRMVLRQGTVLILLGTGVGLLGALAGTRVLRSALFQVDPTDLPTLAGVTGLLCLVALAACWAPARRATRVDPLAALRAE
jgi:putative ABC transport system permease protein